MLNPITARTILVLLAVFGWTAPATAQFDGARVYWTLPLNTNIVGIIGVRGTINAAWTNFQRVEPGVRINNNLYLASYSRSLALGGRSMLVTLLLPAGAIGSDATLPAGSGDEFVQGVGDPSLGFWINLVGAPGLKVKDFIRYDHRTTVALSVTGKFPVGQYNSGSLLNIGANQWKVRFGLPIVQAIGAWVPGRRTTLEIVPTVTLLSNNRDALGETIDQDPAIGIETHLTRDITKRAFISVDYSYLRLGAATRTDNQSGTMTASSGAVSTHLLGATAGFQINDNLSLFVTHMQTVSEDVSAVELQGEFLKVMLSWSWHMVLERVRDLTN